MYVCKRQQKIMSYQQPGVGTRKRERKGGIRAGREMDFVSTSLARVAEIDQLWGTLNVDVEKLLPLFLTTLSSQPRKIIEEKARTKGLSAT